jgi:outer membrane cobalamin receptor
MKKISLFILFAYFFSSFSLFGQVNKSFTINGFVKDVETGEKLINAYVFDQVSKKGVTTNSYGFYSMTLVRDTAAIEVQYIGYAPSVKAIYLNSRLPTELDIELIPSENILDEVTVVGISDIQETTQMSSVSLNMKTLKNLPVLLGETDLLKVIQLLPGVQSGTEGTSGFYVRGGGPDQNLILIDGVPVYNVSHLFGFFSVFNADAINNVQLIKGGFPAEYGGRLSSVLDVRLKEGNMKKWQGTGSIGLISSKLTLEGPLWKDKTSVLLSGRRTYLDVLAQPLIAQNSPDGSAGGYYFYDLNAKINHKINRKNQLYFSFYDGFDEAYIRSKDNYQEPGLRSEEEFNSSLNWGNRIATLRWNWVISPKLFSNVTSTYSRYKFNTRINTVSRETRYVNLGGLEVVLSRDTNTFGIDYLSEIQDRGVRWDFDYAPSPSHAIKYGASLTNHAYQPGVNSIAITSGNIGLDTTFGSFPQDAWDYVFYFQDDWEVTERLKVNAGVHFNGFSVLASNSQSETNYQSLQPRLSARYLLGNKNSIKWSYVQMVQYMHLLSNQTIGLPTDLWVPVTQNIRPQEAWQTAIGYAHNLGNGWELSLEGYYKDMQNLIEYKEGSSFLTSAEDWQQKVTIGRGWAYGIEFLLEKKTGKTTGWLGYTLAKSDRQFPDVNNGTPYPYTYDRRHDISLTVSHEFNERWSGGLVWVYGTGRATSIPTRKYSSFPDFYSNFFEGSGVIEQTSGRNNFREPAYHRLDLGMTYNRQKKWGEVSWQFGVYNAYNRINTFFMDFGSDNNGNAVLKGYGLFPIIPSISYSFKF